MLDVSISQSHLLQDHRSHQVGRLLGRYSGQYQGFAGAYRARSASYKPGGLTIYCNLVTADEAANELADDVGISGGLSQMPSPGWLAVGVAEPQEPCLLKRLLIRDAKARKC